MKGLEITKQAVLAVVLGGLGVQAAQAYTDITIYDGDGYLGGGQSAPGVGEDQETEPGMINSQFWDLEAFFVEGNKQIGMVSGFDFKGTSSGFYPNGRDFTSGDIFIDLDGDHIAGNATANDGNGQHTVADTFGYDLVIDTDWQAGTYKVIQLNNGVASTTKTAWYDVNYGSSPWKYVADANYDPLNTLSSGSFNYESGLSDADVGFSGGRHYRVSGFDLSFLGDNDFYLHFTMGCGNDNLMGHLVQEERVTEPGPLVLLAAGLLGLVAARRRMS